MSEFLVVPVGEVDRTWLDAAAACGQEMLSLPAVVTEPIAVPETSRDSTRKQYLATGVLQQLLPVGRERHARVLGVTEVDIFIPILTFMFGQAQLGGRLALVSLARLRPEFYRLPADHSLMLRRLRKEVRHEIGHTLGLVHCANRSCAMSLSNSIVQVDAKNDSFCAPCLEMSQAHLRTVYTGGKA